MRMLAVCALLSSAVAGAWGCSGPQAALRIHVPADAPVNLPTHIGVKHDFGSGGSDLAKLRCLDASGLGADGVPAQFVADLDADGKPLAHGTVWLPIKIRPEQRGKTLDVRLAPASRKGEPAIHLREIPGEATEFLQGERFVMRYNHGPKGGYERWPGKWVTDYVHPIVGLDGEPISDCAPGDHLHHRGLFWAWVRLSRAGQSRGDWWTLRDTYYRLDRVLRRETGPVLAAVTAEGYWEFQTDATKAPERVIREVAELRLFPANEQHQILEADVSLYAVGENVTLSGQSDKDKGYGGFTLRFKKPARVQMTADGKALRNDGLMYRARWVDYSGSFRGTSRPEWSGATIMTHPSHPGDPPGWCLRHYGILNPSYPGLELVNLSATEPLRFRYRLVLHRQNAEQARVADLFALYVANWATQDR